MASSPARSPASAVSDAEMLTPSRKVQALLAQFDDSDSDDITANRAASTKAQPVQNANSKSDGSESSGESDDDAPVVRKSRMAARLEPTVATNVATRPASIESPRVVDESGEESESGPPLRRRLLTKRKGSPKVRSSPPAPVHPTEPPSPMFFPSPSRSQKSAGEIHKPGADADPDQDEQPSSASKTKFLALVEKQRKIRVEMEEVEKAKRAARQAALEEQSSTLKRQRGSSPGDDSHESSEGSDADAARRMAKRAKPTRKASKKAIEEMKRETQRLSRNTQLAYQAQVKKKITMESFLTRFNGAPAKPIEALDQQQHENPSSPTSAANSDSEAHHQTGTPPTSPLHQSENDAMEEIEKEATNGLVLEAPSLAEIGLEPTMDTSKGKGKAKAVAEQPRPGADSVFMVTAQPPSAVSETLAAPVITKISKRAQLAQLLKTSGSTSADDADDDLDIITSKGDIRKYAAFEKLPKHKARETSSHLALRTLAQLNDKGKDDKSTMTTAEMQSNLRKAARFQARQERQQRIDELRAKGVVVQTAEERERDQEEVEDLVEKARQEAAEISKREKEIAKKDGTFVKDAFDEEDSDEDEDFAESEEDVADSEAEDDDDDDVEEADDKEDDLANEEGKLIDDQADEEDTEDAEISEAEAEAAEEADEESEPEPQQSARTPAVSKVRNARVISDDEEEMPHTETPKLPQLSRTPQTISRSARKQIPGLNMSDDLPLGLTQAFGATMADSQSQSQRDDEDTMDYVGDLPSPGLAMIPRLNRLESLDLITDSQPESQTQSLNINLSFSQSQRVPESPSITRQGGATQATPSQAPFEPTQDEGYIYSPFTGNRFTTETPTVGPHSTIDTVPLHEIDASPVFMRKGRLRRGRAEDTEDADVEEPPAKDTAFEVMKRAAKKAEDDAFDKAKSKAKDIVDEAAEESDDEYAGLGGNSDDENANDVENEEDRRIIDDDTQVGKGDEAALAGFYADRERKSDEAAVNKLYQEIKTGKLRNRRAVNGDLDLSDEEDAQARKREAKRREFAKMRRELLKDEAVGKIAEDHKKEAFLRSIEDRHEASDDDDLEIAESQTDSQSQAQPTASADTEPQVGTKRKRPLEAASESQLNRLPPALRRAPADKKPSTLAEIRENLSFLIEEDSQTGTNTLELSDSEDDEPEKYVNLDRHYDEAEADENAAEEEADGLGDFVVDDEEDEDDFPAEHVFKKPSLPTAASFPSARSKPSSLAAPGAARRTSTVINRLSTLQRSSSLSSNSSVGTTKMAFIASSTTTTGFRVPPLLRRATTNSSLSSMNSSDTVSATGVSVAKATERGHVSEEKVFVRKGMGGRRNAVNYQAGERKVGGTQRGGGKVAAKGVAGKAKGKAKGGFLGDFLSGGTWG